MLEYDRQRFLILYRSIIAILKRPNIKIKLQKSRKNWGATDFETIWLDPRGELLTTLIHEVLHIIYPEEEDEDYIDMLEKKISNTLSNRQYLRLLNILHSKINPVRGK